MAKKNREEQLTKQILIMMQDSFAVIDLIDMQRYAMAGSIITTRREGTAAMIGRMKQEDAEFRKKVDAWQKDIEEKVRKVKESFMPPAMKAPNYMG